MSASLVDVTVWRCVPGPDRATAKMSMLDRNGQGGAELGVVVGFEGLLP